MTPHDPDREHDALARWTAQVLERQPALKAPRTLEDRVLAALDGPAPTPWWRQSIFRWPPAARIGFIVASMACLWLSVVVWTFPEFAGAVSATPMTVSALPGFAPVRLLVDTVSALQTTSSIVARAVPLSWWYGGFGLVVATYAMVFGLGAFGYRTFRRPPSLLPGTGPCP
jgi:hypothetical protein